MEPRYRIVCVNGAFTLYDTHTSLCVAQGAGVTLGALCDKLNAKVVCASCGSPKLEAATGDAELWDHRDGTWTFDIYKCLECDERTLVTFTSEESTKIFEE